jgi:predicted nucleic acid-binding Zn ribbon protein
MQLEHSGEIEMDCPNCGVYNPEGRQVCWRCDRELPKPQEPKKRKGSAFLDARRMWIIVAIVLLIYILFTWLLPLFLGGGATPTP